jgi:uncharacterized phage protein gp47/JayE|nr:MAG TPA: Baseplate wedge protein [Caudoviricetes sp.]
MADYGLTDAGFVIPTYDEVLDNYLTALKNTFGADTATSEDTVFGQLFRIIAYTDYTLWEGMQGVYNTQTLDGAEGVYLDEIFSKRGFYRKGATAGSGYAYIKTDKKAPWDYIVDTSVSFAATNSMDYNVSTDTELKSSVAAFSVSKAQATNVATSMTFYAQKTSADSLNSITLTTSSSTFLTDLRDFIIANVQEIDEGLVSVANNTVYMGFRTSDYNDPIGLSTSIKFYASANVGFKWSLIPVVADQTGYNPLGIEGISSISSTFNGYVESGNFTEFSSGTDIETDAEYRSRFNDNLDEASAATRPAILRALLNLSGVSKVKIYDNPTLVDEPYAPACSFQTVVYGGEDGAIAQALYQAKPINTLTYGTTAITVTTEDNGLEVIKFSRGETVTYNLRIVYTSANGRQLSVTEQNNIALALKNLQAYFEIGSLVTNDQIKGVIYSALDFGRLTSLRVYVKLSNEPDSSFAETDLTPDYNELPAIDTNNLAYVVGD